MKTRFYLRLAAVVLVVIAQTGQGLTLRADTTVPIGILAPSTIYFDTNINPFQNPQFPNLSARAQSVAIAHDQARTESLLAVQYLLINKNSILSGNDAVYNSIFGGYYDPASQGISAHSVTTAHYQHVLSTYQTLNQLLATPTTYNEPTGVIPSPAFDNVFGYNMGQRHWGVSNSDSEANYVAQFTGVPLTPIQVPAINYTPLAWYLDNALATNLLPNNGNDPQRVYASSVDRAFLNQKLDIFGSAATPNVEYLGETFFNQRERAGSPASDPFLNSNLALHILGNGLIDTTSIYDAATMRSLWNSGVNATSHPETLQTTTITNPLGIPITTTTFDPTLAGVGYFSPTKLSQWQMIMSSFTEFTPSLADPRGGAFWGVQELASRLDPTGASQVYIGVFDASNFAKFTAALNAEGISDPRIYPPFHKNATFVPGIPTP